MGNLLTRRRELILASGDAPLPTPLYQLEAATSAGSYDTGFAFTEVQSFTILCTASFKNYDWGASGSYVNATVWGVGTDTVLKLGNIKSGTSYDTNGVAGSATHYYTAHVMNVSSSGKKCASARSRNASVEKGQYALKYDASTKTVYAYSSNHASHLPRWWTLGGQPVNMLDKNFKFNISTDGSFTMHDFKVYGALLSDAQIADYVWGD